MNTYILPHLGIGDYIVINGLIRNIINKEDSSKNFILFCNRKYKVSVPFMFRDIKNLSYSYIPAVEMSRYYILPYIREKDYKLIVIGYDAIDYKTSVDMMFYKQFNIDFEKRWSDFYVQRDEEREKKLFKHFNVKENEYIFLHEGGSENKNIIDRTKINSNLKIVFPDLNLTDNIFDYCYLIEHAAEIHCVESGFLFLIDSIPTNGKLFSHRYARQLYEYTVPHLKKQWTIWK
jgi:hypothetical protein